ncbi:MAG: Rieske 2Fe-2S domain-containing protein [Deltaproteobacteria bacterium]|nr:Rieske 2Fe-2S domain-containing protein [Deltaproteobacteria bacterium]
MNPNNIFRQEREVLQAGEETTKQPRRAFLAGGIKAIAALFGLGLGVPLALFSFSPARQKDRPEEWIPIADFASLNDHRPTKVTYAYTRQDGWMKTETRRMAFILKKDDGGITVLSNRCTHLGCGVDWDATANQFKCPCHGGIFDLEGKILEGPPPKSLARFTAKVEDGRVFIREGQA